MRTGVSGQRFRHQHEQGTGRHRGHADKADLAVLHFGEATKRVAPEGGRDQRQDAFEHQHERESQ